ncbi:transketolase [Suillus americanus]|nr:transketolase [Suillus americanus]
MSDNLVVLICKTKVEREGSNLAIVTHSKMVVHIMDATGLLIKERINAEVINLRSIRPLDDDTIKASESGGFPPFSVPREICTQIVEKEAFENLDALVERVTSADVPTPVRVEMP